METTLTLPLKPAGTFILILSVAGLGYTISLPIRSAPVRITYTGNAPVVPSTKV